MPLPPAPRRPRALELFCGAGGTSMGYYLAGFDVVGVDVVSQPRYPFEFRQADAMALTIDELRFFDLIHAGPPCQGYSQSMKHLAYPTPMLIGEVREMLEASSRMYVIENVVGAPLRDPVMLCGTMFGLPIRRHRLFEVSVGDICAPRACDHTHVPLNPHDSAGCASISARYGHGRNCEIAWREAMGVGWMERYEARESMPPAYTHHIGRLLAARLAGGTATGVEPSIYPEPGHLVGA